MTSENWKQVAGYEGHYLVSDRGRIRSVGWLVPYKSGPAMRRVLPRIMKLSTDSDGYLLVKLRLCGKPVMAKAHRLVAEAFLPNPEGKPQINHIDCDKKNNCAGNLEWVTAKEHGLHSSTNGLRPIGSNCGSAKLVEADIPVIRSRLAAGESATLIGKDYGVSQYPILCVKHDRTWRHVPRS